MDSEMACDPKAYQGICDKKLAYIRNELRAMGLEFPDEHEGRIHSADIGGGIPLYCTYRGIMAQGACKAVFHPLCIHFCALGDCDPELPRSRKHRFGTRHFLNFPDDSNRLSAAIFL